MHQHSGVWEGGGEGKGGRDFFKKLAHVITEAGKFKICKMGPLLEVQEN